MENKNLSDPHIEHAFDDFLRTFDAFKSANDERLGVLEKRMSADVLSEEKIDRINQTLDQQKEQLDTLVLKNSRPGLAAGSSGGSESVDQLRHKTAFNDYIRRGEQKDLRDVEAKALSVGSDPDGGYLAPEQTENSIMRSLSDISPIRAISGNRKVSASVYKKPFSISGPGTGWVGETDARPETSTPTLSELSFPTMELYAMPAATASILEDAAVNVDEWLAEEVNVTFAEQEGSAFVNGDGLNKPRGFLDYPKTAETSWSWGNLGYIATGTSGALNTSNPSDNLVDLIYSIKSGYRSNASWVMNRSTQAEIRKIKDGDGNYIWRPGEQAGAAPTLMNAPIAESEDMPDMGANSYSIAFGDFRRGYLVVDRQGIRILRDPYSSKPYVLFYTTKRVGGGVQDFDAIKLMKFGTS